MNKECVGKFIIVQDLSFTEIMKDEKGNTKVYPTYKDALLDCFMYEFENCLIIEVKHNYIEDEI